MRSPKAALDLIERCMPNLNRRDWGAIAVAAARRAGLEDPDVRELRRHLEDQWAVDAQPTSPPTAIVIDQRGRR